MRHYLLPTLLFTSIAIPSALAESKSANISKLETVVVTATREARRKMDIPESIQSFDRETIDAVSPSHPSEILNRAAGVHVNNLGGEGHMTSIRQPITTRGVYLYLEDGVPIRPTGFFNHNSLYEVNIPQSGQLEVTKGPGPALYGSDAIGGIINSISRIPPSETEVMLNLEAGSDDWKRALLSAGTTQGKHGFVINLNVTDNKGYSDEADYSRESITGRWDVAVNEKLAIKTLFSYTEVDQSGVSSLEEFDYKNDDAKNTFHGDTAFREVEALRVSSEFSWELNDKELLTLTPYLRDNTMTMSPSWMVTYDPNERESSFQSYGLLTKYRINTSDKTLWILGLDVDYTPSEYQEGAIDHTQVGDIYTGYSPLGNSNYDYDAEQTSISPYVHLEVQLTEKLVASLGVRYDNFDINYEDNLDNTTPSRVFIPQLGRPVSHLRPEDQKTTFEEFSPKLGLVYQANDNHAAYINYRQAFSIPSVGTLFRSGSTLNTDELEPITSDSYEIGVRGEATSWLFYEVAVYLMQIEDDIVSVVNGFERNVYNAGETEHKGIEISLSGAITEEFSYALALTITEQQYEKFSYTCCFPSTNVDVSGNDIALAPETIGNFTLAYVPSALPALRIEIEWEHLGEYYTDNSNTEKYDGHDLYNLRANYQITDAFELYARVQNISDELYSTYTSNQVGDPDISYRPGQPRSIYGGFRYTF
ncbi:TonB-dependent receptor [Oceanicoccus sp. KOV_DT_Chl]|uniref:TonB-dependent receptor n=1 Tax=Oceanicoccus sp. KOV_DT_Chl TaxID=1904639 RepID=UPI000C79A089|nr:TonB-dependent receptor [Oceanicoccus sp. KOV_DT_Chl]